MSLYDKASVALIPSGTKASKLYSVLPANGNGDFTHTRGSTATRLNKDGLIESVATNVPRLDYPLIDGAVQDCPALLLEPSRTNLITYSEDFTQSVWTKNNVTISANSTISPYGALTASTLENGTGNKRLQFTLTTTTSSTYNVFVFFKAKDTSAEGSIIAYNSSFTPLSYAEYNVQNGTIGTSSGTSSMENYGNGWYRCRLEFTATTTTSYIRFRVGNYLTGDDNKDIFIFGSQVELGSYATSYIPTSGSTATRSADVCNGSGTSAEFNVTEGVLFAEIKGLVDVDTGNRYISLTDGTVANSVMIQYRNTGELRLYNGGTSTSNMIFRDASADLTQNKKVAIKYGSSTSDYIVFMNGFKKTVESGFSASALTALDEIKFTYVSSGNTWYGNAKQLITFKKALTDSELETLTSYDSFDDMATGQLYTIE